MLHTNIGGLPEYTENTRSYIMTYTGHDRRLYTRLPQLCEVPQYTLKIHGHIL